MEQLFTSGRIFDVILVAMALEVVIFGFWLWRRKQGLALVSFVASTVAGGSLVLALRAAITGAGWLFVAIYLAASLLAHVGEMVLRILAAEAGSDDSSADVQTPP